MDRTVLGLVWTGCQLQIEEGCDRKVFLSLLRMALTKIDLEKIGEMIDERQGKHVLPLINRILDMMVTKEEAKNFATKDDLKDLEIILRGEANENYLALKADIDEVIGLLGANV